MKVWIENYGRDVNELTGKGLFLCRLADAMAQMGVQVSNDATVRADVALNPIRITNHNARVRVLRLNGVYHNSEQDYNKRNTSIATSLHTCDAVVYQSLHSKLLCDSFVGMATVPHAVIHNGSDPTFYEQAKLDKEAWEKVTYLAFNRWRPHKRLVDIIESFLLANVANSQLLIAGDTSKVDVPTNVLKSFASRRVRFLGKLDQSTLASLVASSRAVIHLCWFDACPNSVVESLCAGVPVISNNVGGTHELLEAVGLDHLICDVDQPYDYSPIRLYHPPPIDRRIVAQKIQQVATKTWRIGVHSKPLHIRNIAEQYINFFEGLL
jgi:glycosyltransferase involved in cell wall biosynthesis